LTEESKEHNGFNDSFRDEKTATLVSRFKTLPHTGKEVKGVVFQRMMQLHPFSYGYGVKS
jgi:hypothetical protein